MMTSEIPKDSDQKLMYHRNQQDKLSHISDDFQKDP